MPLRLEALDFAEQDGRVDGDAVADHAGLFGVKDAGGNEVELELATLVDDGMAGVVPGGIAGNNTGFAGEQVDDPAFAFVAPLAADNDDDGHGRHTPGLPLSGEAR